MFIDPNNRETDVASNLLAIRHRKRQVLFLDTDSDFLKDFFGDPGVFASCVHHDVEQLMALNEYFGSLTSTMDHDEA